MSSNAFNLGDDPALAADVFDPSVVPSTDTSFPGYIDPLANVEALNTNVPNPFLYGTIGGIPGPAAPAGYDGTIADPSAFNANPTTASQPGTSVLDMILKMGTLGLGFTSALMNKGSAVANNATTQSNPVKTSKSTGGTSTSLVWLAAALFIGIFLWLEFNH